MTIVVDAISLRLDICHSLYNITDIHIAKPSITESAVMKIYFPYFIDNVYAIKVPKGTTIYTGSVGPQGGVYVGGYNVMQTYIDAPWTFEVVGKTPLQ